MMGVMKDRMLRGDWHIPDDSDLAVDHARAQAIIERYNRTAHNAYDERARMLRELLGSVGDRVIVRPPFRCDYGHTISIGEGSFVNLDCVMIDAALIDIGTRCQIGPRVQFVTSTHPVDPIARRGGWEKAQPITVGDNVWLGAGVIVCPGVVIGSNTVVGAGAVVTRDLPADRVAAGVPASVRRELGPEDHVDVPES
jgi:maltose O-acetyltransferase